MAVALWTMASYVCTPVGAVLTLINVVFVLLPFGLLAMPSEWVRRDH